MTLGLIRAFADGIKRTATPTGAILFVGLAVLQALTLAATNTVVASALPAEAVAEVPIGLTLPVPESAAFALLLVSWLLTGAYFVVVARGFARPRAQLSGLPAELYTRRMGRATLSMLVGGLVVLIAVTVGLVLFIIPGVFFAAAFLFFIFAVGVEDRGVLGGLKRSWALARGNRLRLAVLVVLVGLLSVVVSIVPTLFQAVGEALVSDVLSIVLNSVLFIFVYGIMAAAYVQVSGSQVADAPEL